MQNFNKDELAILDSIANSSQPITIKGNEAEGRNALGEAILSFNQNRRVLYNQEGTYKCEIARAIEAIEVIEKAKQVMIGPKLPVALERSLGDHIQLRSYQLDNGERIFKVNFVKIPKDNAPHVVFGHGKTTALLVIKNDRNIDDVEVTIKDNRYTDCIIKETKVTDLGTLDEILEYLGTLKKLNGKLFDAVKINDDYKKNIIIVDVKSLIETTSNLDNLELKSVFRDKLIKLAELTKELNTHLLIIDKGANSLVETFGVYLKVNIYINEVTNESTV